MFRHIRWKLLATYLIVVFAALVFLGVHLTRQFEVAYTDQLEGLLLDLGRLLAGGFADGLATGNPEAVRRQLADGYGGDLAVFVTDEAGAIVAGSAMVRTSLGSVAADHPGVAEGLRGSEVVGVGTAPGGEKSVYAVVPVRAAGRVIGTMHVARPLSSLEAQVRHLRWVVAWATLVALVIAAGLGVPLARSIAGPVQEMQRVAGALAAGRLGERVPVRTQDEVGALARSLNFMASELERMEVTRRAFVADASHELRTPVANLAVAIEALKTLIDRDPGQARAAAHDLEREVDRLRELVEHLLDLSQVESGRVQLRLEPVTVSEVIERAVQPFRARAEQAGIALSVETSPRLPRVRADADRTVQVLTNLLDNALKFTPQAGRVTVRASDRRGHVLIGVADTGPGIPEAELPHIFDRFHKVDKARPAGRGGAGLGLAIAKRLVEAQGGIIMVESREGAGSQFIVALPKET